MSNGDGIYEGSAGSLLRIAEALESEANTASRAGQTWSLNQLAQELRGAHKDVIAKLQSDAKHIDWLQDRLRYVTGQEDEDDE
jgi:hypothetical protein